jgi:ribulose-phosphate 3-epimerase
MVLVMSVNPGFGGQRFIPGSTSKVARVRAMLDTADNAAAEIQVDGGIGPETVRSVVAAGATVVVAGAAVFRGAGTVAENIASIRSAAAQASGP